MSKERREKTANFEGLGGDNARPAGRRPRTGAYESVIWTPSKHC